MTLPGYPELMRSEQKIVPGQLIKIPVHPFTGDKINYEEITVPTLSKFDIVHLPQPPAPTGINEFPASPSVQILKSEYLHIVESHNDNFDIRAEGVQRQMTGAYKKITQGTATVNSSFTQSESYTWGASNTKSFSVGLSVTVGGEVGFLGTGATFEATVST